MSKMSFIDSVEVKDPCSEDWETMQGNERVRFCSHCSKSVNNLSEMTRKEAMRLVRASGGNICIRYIPNPVTKRPLFADQMFHITRRTPRLAAGVISASLGLSTFAYTQGGATANLINVRAVSNPDERNNLISAKPVEDRPNKPEPVSRGKITGTIYDPNGAVIPFATVAIYSVSAGKTATTKPDDSGMYKFEDLVPGTYRIEIDAPGFRTNSKEVVVSDQDRNADDVQLEIGFEITVDVVIDVDANLDTAVSGGAMSVEYATDLARAVGDDDIDRVKELLLQGENVNGKDENYDNITPLFIAVENGNLEISRLLLDFGAKVNARNKSKQTPLMQIDSDATVDLVTLLIDRGAKVNLIDDENNTALIIAADGASTDVVRALVDAGADVNLANKDGETALMNAANRGEAECVRLLLNAGADINAVDKDGDNAWIYSDNEETDSVLIAFGVRMTERKRDQPKGESADN